MTPIWWPVKEFSYFTVHDSGMKKTLQKFMVNMMVTAKDFHTLNTAVCFIFSCFYLLKENYSKSIYYIYSYVLLKLKKNTIILNIKNDRIITSSIFWITVECPLKIAVCTSVRSWGPRWSCYLEVSLRTGSLNWTRACRFSQ